MSNFEAKVDAILNECVNANSSVPGVAAVATDRNGTIYEGTAGKRVLGQDAAMTTDTVCALFSATKAIAGTATLQLVEEDRLDLDAPASTYASEIANVQVLDGFKADGTPKLRPPKRDITTRMLLLHTAGFGYDCFNEQYQHLANEQGQLSPITGTRASLQSPLLFDPGEQWEYGCNIDWVGQVIEGITGKRLGEVCRERIFEPLGMNSTAFTLTDDMRSRLAIIHQRGSDGTLTPLMDFELPEPEVDMGGHGLYRTVDDYCKFIRMWLNGGDGPGGRILKPETVKMAAKNGLDGNMKISGLPAVNPELTNYVEFFPGMPKTWGLTFMINDEQAPTGQPAGSLAWAGFANLYYWIDRQNGVGGFWATQIFPFADPASVGGYLSFETAIYDSLSRAEAA